MVTIQEVVTTLLNRARRIYAAADSSKNLKGAMKKQIKEATAAIIGAVVTLGERASGSNVNERLDALSRDIDRLTEENRRLKEILEKMHARESVIKGTPLPNTLGPEEKPLEQRVRKPRGTPLPPKDGTPRGQQETESRTTIRGWGALGLQTGMGVLDWEMKKNGEAGTVSASASVAAKPQPKKVPPTTVGGS